MSDRQDFTLKYLVALYQVHRNNRDSSVSINSLKNHFVLPSDSYLESELSEMLQHRSWAMSSQTHLPYGDWELKITMLGKEAAEAQIAQGLEILPISAFVDDSDIRSDEVGTAPAADRIVLLNDNQPAVDRVRSTLVDLARQLQIGNDLGDLTDEEVAEAKHEVWLLEQSFKSERVRVDWIEPLAKNSLKWIAEKAAGAAVGKAALTALAAIAALLGFSF